MYMYWYTQRDTYTHICACACMSACTPPHTHTTKICTMCRQYYGLDPWNYRDHYVGAGNQSEPVQEQQAVFTTEPSLQPPFCFVQCCSVIQSGLELSV